MTGTSLKSRRRMLMADAPAAGDERLTCDRVRKQILEMVERQFAPRLRLPPMSQLAREFSVSVGTVNQTIRGLAGEGLLVSRQRVGTMLAPGCRIDDIRRSLARRRGGTSTHARVRVMLDIDCDAMVQEMADSFARAIAAAGGLVDFAEYPEHKPGQPLPSFTDESGIDATALFQPPAMNLIRWEGSSPLVVVATDMRVVEAARQFDQISVDDEYGSYLAGRRFRETGHRSVCFIGRRDRSVAAPAYDAVAQRRLAGFERGWGERLSDAFRLFSGSRDLHHGAGAFADYIALSPRPEGVFCDCDDLAIGFHIGAFTHHLRAGRDFSLIGFDKQQMGLSIPAGPLTTVEAPRQAIGERAAELLLDRLEKPDQPVRRVSLGCTLFEGKTLIDHHKEQPS